MESKKGKVDFLIELIRKYVGLTPFALSVVFIFVDLICVYLR